MDKLQPPELSIQPDFPVLPTPLPGYRDRSTGLVICGIVQIICGGLAALAVPFILLSMLLSRKTLGIHQPVSHSVSSVATYAFLAVTNVALGIGSIQARRWARALTLVTSWIWLVLGALLTVLFVAVLPASFMMGMRRAASAHPGGPPMPVAFAAVILTLVIVLFAIFLIALPLAFVVFYSRKDVIETCLHRDPIERWTDRIPMPVLAAVLLFSCGAAYYGLTAASTPIFPLFGRYLTGLPAALCGIATAMVDAVVAYLFFRLSVSGWWLAVGMWTLRLISAGITFWRADLYGAYGKMGFGQSELQVIQSSPLFRSHVFLWWSWGAMILLLGYLIWLKRFFPGSGEDALPVAATLSQTSN